MDTHLSSGCRPSVVTRLAGADEERQVSRRRTEVPGARPARQGPGRVREGRPGGSEGHAHLAEDGRAARQARRRRPRRARSTSNGEIYTEQGFFQKAVAVYKNVLKLSPGLPQVRTSAGEVYKRLGLVSDAVHELELAAPSCRVGQAAEALPALREIVEIHPENVVSRIKLAEAASQAGATDEAIREFGQAADQLRRRGAPTSSCASPSACCFTSPTTTRWRASWPTPTSRQEPAAGAGQAAGRLKAEPRDPQNVALLARGAGAAGPAQGGVGLEGAGRDSRRGAPRGGARRRHPRGAGAGSHRRRDARAGGALGTVAGRRCGARRLPLPRPARAIARCVTSVQVVPPESAPQDRSGMRSGLSRPGTSGPAGPTTSRASWPRRRCS